MFLKNTESSTMDGFLFKVAAGLISGGTLKVFDKEAAAFSETFRAQLSAWSNNWLQSNSPEENENINNLIKMAFPDVTQLESGWENKVSLDGEPIDFVNLKPSVIGSLIEWARDAKKIGPDQPESIKHGYTKALKELLKGNNAMVTALSELDTHELKQLSEAKPLPMKVAKKLYEMGLGEVEPPLRGDDNIFGRLLLVLAPPLAFLFLGYFLFNPIFVSLAYLVLQAGLFWVVFQLPYNPRNLTHRLWYDNFYRFRLSLKGYYVIYEMFGQEYREKQGDGLYLYNYIQVALDGMTMKEVETYMANRE